MVSGFKASSSWFQGLHIYYTPLCLLRETLATIFLPEISCIDSYNKVYNLNEVPNFRLNILVVEFTITSVLSFVISPIATWKVIAPIFISYTVGQEQVTVPKIPEKEEDGWRSSWLLQEKHEGSPLSSFPLEINPNITMSLSLLSFWVVFFKEIRRQCFVAVEISTFSQWNRMRQKHLIDHLFVCKSCCGVRSEKEDERAKCTLISCWHFWEILFLIFQLYWCMVDKQKWYIFKVWIFSFHCEMMPQLSWLTHPFSHSCRVCVCVCVENPWDPLSANFKYLIHYYY